jgi:predicted transcriptional regulator
MMESTTIRPTSIKIDEETKNRMKRLAQARHRSSHWLIIEAIHQYIEREEKRQALHQDAINAWKEYQATGLHATSEEVISWLNTWGEGDEQGLLECHP